MDRGLFAAFMDRGHGQLSQNMNDAPALVLVTTSFPINGDGSEAAGSFVSDIAEELARHVPVRVVAPGAKSIRETWATDVEVFRYAAPAKPLSTLKPWKLADALQTIRVLRAGAEATRRAVAAGPTAHILALWGLPCGEWARRTARESGIRYSIWMLGSDVWSLGRVPILRSMLARVMRQAAHAYADGYKLAEDAQRIGRVPVGFLPSTRKISLIDPPPPRTHPPYRLLFLGRWHPNKGVDLLLDALDLLSVHDWRRIESVEIQGGGPLEALVCERVAALCGKGRPVELGGFLAKPAAEAAIVRADWVVIPSRIESIPLVFSDAMKLGRPVITTPVGDLPQLLAAHKCGVLGSAVDKVGIAQALKLALRNKVGDYSASVRSASQAFSIRFVVDRLLRDFDEIV